MSAGHLSQEITGSGSAAVIGGSVGGSIAFIVIIVFFIVFLLPRCRSKYSLVFWKKDKLEKRVVEIVKFTNGI